VTLTFDFAGDQQKNGSDGCTSSICGGNYDALLAVTLGGAAATSGLTNDGTLLDAAKGATSGDTTTGLASEAIAIMRAYTPLAFFPRSGADGSLRR
jgi:hypothetical protein